MIRQCLESFILERRQLPSSTVIHHLLVSVTTADSGQRVTLEIGIEDPLVDLMVFVDHASTHLLMSTSSRG